MQSKPDMFIWVYDYNYRDYTDNDGNRTSSVNYAKQWRKHKVVDETSRSWVLDDGMKIPKNGKKTYDRLGSFVSYAMSQSDVDDIVWRHDNINKIKDNLGSVDVEMLRRIAVMTGYES